MNISTHDQDEEILAAGCQGSDINPQLFREILELLDVGVLILDHSSHLLYANQFARDLLSLPEDYRGKSALHEITIPYLAPYFSFAEAVLASAGEFVIPSQEENKRTIKVHACLLLGGADSGRGVILLRDISHEKNLEALKDEFASKISHEFRTPLTIIKGQLVNMMKERLGAILPVQEKALRSAIESIERLNRMVHKLLDLSKYEAGRLRVHRRTIQPSQLTKQVVADLQVKAQEAGITLDTDYPDNLGLIRVDTDLMEQVLINLIDNALRYAKSHICIRFLRELDSIDGQEKNKDVLKIQVIDDGPGIPEDRLADMFNKFVQVGRTYGPGYKGTGLGLSIVRQIMQLHYGRVWADNNETKGARINLILPIFHEETALTWAIETGLAQAHQGNRHLGLIALRFDTAEIPPLEAMADVLQKQFLEAHEEILLWTERNTLVALVDRLYPKVILIAERLQDFLQGLSGEARFFSGFHISVAFYPQDGQSAKALLEACTKHAKPLAEVVEELSKNIFLSGKGKAG